MYLSYTQGGVAESGATKIDTTQIRQGVGVKYQSRQRALQRAKRGQIDTTQSQDVRPKRRDWIENPGTGEDAERLGYDPRKFLAAHVKHYPEYLEKVRTGTYDPKQDPWCNPVLRGN